MNYQIVYNLPFLPFLPLKKVEPNFLSFLPFLSLEKVKPNNLPLKNNKNNKYVINN
jgi:hypothetical protein